MRRAYVTHSHVDHFNGATLLRAAFPNAKFYAQPTAIPVFAPMVAERQAGLGAAASDGLPNVTAPVPDFFEPVPADGLAIDGQKVEIIRGVGDHPDSSVVWVSSARTVITGDVVFSRTHAFTGDGDDIAGWIELVRTIQALKPDRVVVGHEPAEDRRDASVLDKQIRWLEDYRAARAKDPSAEAVKRTMTAKYPGMPTTSPSPSPRWYGSTEKLERIDDMKIGFIGVDSVGGSLANLLQAGGHDVTVGCEMSVRNALTRPIALRRGRVSNPSLWPQRLLPH